MIKVENVQDLELKLSEEIKDSTFASYYEAPKVNWGPLWVGETPTAFYLIKAPNVLTAHFIDFNGKIIRTKHIKEKDLISVDFGKKYFGLTSTNPILNVEYRDEDEKLTRIIQVLESKFGKTLEELKVALLPK